VRVLVNSTAVTLTSGMTVRHALTALTGEAPAAADWDIRDQWGNRLGLDGALRDGDRIEVLATHILKGGVHE